MDQQELDDDNGGTLELQVLVQVMSLMEQNYFRHRIRL